MAENIKNMFKYVPKISMNKSQKSLDNFKRLQRLSIEEIIRSSNKSVDFFNHQLEFKTHREVDHFLIGQFKRGSTTLDGLGRIVFSNTEIQEG